MKKTISTSSGEVASFVNESTKKIESDTFRFSKISLGYHFVEKSTEKNFLKRYEDLKRCQAIGSYEFDLFQYRYQKKPPYRTHCFSEFSDLTCQIKFPEFTPYNSEGRNERLFCTRTKIYVNIKVSCTFFSNGTRIWTFIFYPQNNFNINQDEVIKLISLFCTPQEGNELACSIQFEFENKEAKSFTELANSIVERIAGTQKKLFASDKVDLTLINSGIVQIDTSTYMSKKETLEKWNEILGLIDKTSKNDLVAYHTLHDSYENNSKTKEILDLMCGISLGIFDYTRMSFNEVMDTLRPICVNENSMILMNKGILCSISHGDEMYQETLQTIGINPYLLISSAVLAFDDFESSRAENILDNLLSISTPTKKLSELTEIRKEIQRTVNEEILLNVFHYPTERITLEYGLSHRGIKDRILNINNRLSELKSLITDRIERGNRINKAIVSLLLAAISVLSSEAVFDRLYKSYINDNGFSGMWENEKIKWLVFIPFSILLFSIILIFNLRDIKKNN